MMAIALGTGEDVEQLLEGPSELGARDRFDRTPWLLAAHVGEVKKAELLFSKGAQLEERGRCGNTALMVSAAVGNSALVDLLVEHGADIEATDDMGNTALIVSAQSGKSNCVQILLEAGAIPSRKNKYNETAKSMASNESVIRLLIEADEDLSDIRTEMKRMLTGFQNEESFKVRKSEYRSGKTRRFSRSNKVTDAESNEVDRSQDHATIVLIVRMNHHDIVRAVVERSPITSLLVPAVAEVLFVSNDGQPDALRNFDRVVSTAIVNQDDVIDRTGRDIGDSSFQRSQCIVSGHDGDRLSARPHGVRW